MSASEPEIVVLATRIEPAELRRLVERFEDMVKYVVDVDIEYTSLINIRPAAGNRSMELLDQALRERVRAITFALLGEGEPL